MKDKLVEALEEFSEGQEGSVADQTIRVLVAHRLTQLEVGLQRLQMRQDAMLFMLFAAIVGQVVAGLVGAGQ